MDITEKLYYLNTDLLSADTSWRKDEDRTKIILDKSPAFPEGGGQIGDVGVIEQNGASISFVDTQKAGHGRMIIRQDFPTISVDHQVSLTLGENLPETFSITEPITVKVDPIRRAATTRSHTAAHLVWLALTERFGNLYPVVKGCHIVEAGGRFDLLIERPTDQDLRDAEAFIRDWVAKDYPIEMRVLPDEPECRIWVSNGKEIPCGGTHLSSCGGVGPLSLRVKSKGKSGFRVVYEYASTAQS